jgi:hypothetical protein
LAGDALRVSLRFFEAFQYLARFSFRSIFKEIRYVVFGFARSVAVRPGRNRQERQLLRGRLSGELRPLLLRHVRLRLL